MDIQTEIKTELHYTLSPVICKNAKYMMENLQQISNCCHIFQDIFIIELTSIVWTVLIN